MKNKDYKQEEQKQEEEPKQEKLNPTYEQLLAENAKLKSMINARPPQPGNGSITLATIRQHLNNSGLPESEIEAISNNFK